MTKYSFLKPLTELSLQEYQQAKSSGMFWVWYPDATGCVDEDLDAVVIQFKRKVREVDYGGNLCPNLSSYKSFFYDIIDQEVEYDW